MFCQTGLTGSFLLEGLQPQDLGPRSRPITPPQATDHHHHPGEDHELGDFDADIVDAALEYSASHRTQPTTRALSRGAEGSIVQDSSSVSAAKSSVTATVGPRAPLPPPPPPLPSSVPTTAPALPSTPVSHSSCEMARSEPHIPYSSPTSASARERENESSYSIAALVDALPTKDISLCAIESFSDSSGTIVPSGAVDERTRVPAASSSVAEAPAQDKSVEEPRSAVSQDATESAAGEVLLTTRTSTAPTSGLAATLGAAFARKLASRAAGASSINTAAVTASETAVAGAAVVSTAIGTRRAVSPYFEQDLERHEAQGPDEVVPPAPQPRPRPGAAVLPSAAISGANTSSGSMVRRDSFPDMVTAASPMVRERGREELQKDAKSREKDVMMAEDGEEDHFPSFTEQELESLEVPGYDFTQPPRFRSTFLPPSYEELQGARRHI